MLVFNHLIGTKLEELRNFRFYNVSSLSGSLTSANRGLLELLTSDNEPYFYNGTSWIKFRSIGAVGDIPLTSGQFLVGNGSNVAAMMAKISIPLSGFGAAVADVAMGNFKLTGLGACTLDGDAANKAYVDLVAQGLQTKESCYIASNGVLPRSPTYNTTTLRLTAASNGALTAVEVDSGAGSGTLSVGTRLLIKNQATSSHNGLYVVNDLGSAGTPYILGRSADANENLELLGAYAQITYGTYVNTGWQQTSTVYDITVPSGTIIWQLFSSAGSYSAGNGLVLSGTTFHFSQSDVYTAGQMFYATSGTAITPLGIGNSNRFLYVNTTVPAWSAYSMPAPGSVLTANQLLYCSSTTQVSGLGTVNSGVLVTSGAGVPSIATDIPTAVTIGATYIYRVGGTDVSLADGGTGGSLAVVNGGVVYSSAAALAISASAGATGYFLRSGTSGLGAPTWYNLLGETNTWTNVNSFNSTSSPGDLVTLLSAARTDAGVRDSTYLKFTGNAWDTANHTANWRAFCNPTSNAGVSSFVFASQVDGAGYTNRAKISDTGIFSFSGTSLVFQMNGILGTITWSPSTSDKTLTIPNLSGTVMLINAVQTVTAAHIFTGAPSFTSSDVAFNIRGWPSRVKFWNSADTFSINLRAPSAVTSEVEWILPVGTNTANYYLATNGTGVLSFQQITAAHIGSPATLSGSNDTNVTLGISTGACLLAASMLTLGWTGYLALARGGTNASLVASNGGIVYSTASALAVLSATASARQLLWSGASTIPAWSPYSMPATVVANAIFYASSISAIAAITPANSSIMTSDASGVPSWGLTLNPVREVTGAARKWAKKVVGDGSNAYITANHGLNTTDVSYSIRRSASTETLPYEYVLTKCEAIDANNIRFYFTSVQTVSDYYVVTVTG